MMLNLKILIFKRLSWVA